MRTVLQMAALAIILVSVCAMVLSAQSAGSASAVAAPASQEQFESARALIERVERHPAHLRARRPHAACGEGLYPQVQTVTHPARFLPLTEVSPDP